MSVIVGGYNEVASNTSFNTIQQRFTAKSTVSVPSDLRITSAKYGTPLLREPVKIRVQSSTFMSNGNNEVIVQLSNDGIYDFRRGYVTYDVTLSQTGGTYIRLAQGAWSIWYRMRTLLGFELENMQEYNRIYSLLWDAINDERQSAVIGMGLMGIGTPSQRNTLGATTSHYAIPLLSGFLDQDPLPLNMFNQVAELRLTMGDASTFVECDGASPIVTISNFILHCERISASSSYTASVQSSVLTQGLTLSFPTWQYYSQSLPAGSQNLNSLFINHKSASLSSIVQIWTPQQTVNSTTTNDKFLNWQRLTNQHQFKIYGRFFPEEAIVYNDPAATEAYFVYLNWLTDEWQLSGELRGTPAPISNLQFSQGNRFLTIMDVNGYPEDKDVINALGTENSTVQLQFDAYLTNALATPQRADFFVKYHRQIYVNPAGVAVITY